MSNMSHCRFHNTLQDLADCQDHMDDDALSPAEVTARAKLIRLCCQIANDYGVQEDHETASMRSSR